MTMTIDERNALVLANERLANYWAGRYAGSLGADDAKQEAYLAMAIASRRFDPAKAPGGDFGRYAGKAIRNRLLRAVERRPKWATESTLRGDDGLWLGSLPDVERPSGAGVDRAERLVREALAALDGFQREILMDRLGLLGRPRLKWAEMERKHGRSQETLRLAFRRARTAMAAALAPARGLSPSPTERAVHRQDDWQPR